MRPAGSSTASAPICTLVSACAYCRGAKTRTGGRNCFTSSVCGASPARRRTAKTTTAAQVGAQVVASGVTDAALQCKGRRAVCAGLGLARRALASVPQLRREAASCLSCPRCRQAPARCAPAPCPPRQYTSPCSACTPGASATKEPRDPGVHKTHRSQRVVAASFTDTTLGGMRAAAQVSTRG